MKLKTKSMSRSDWVTFWLLTAATLLGWGYLISEAMEVLK